MVDSGGFTSYSADTDRIFRDRLDSVSKEISDLRAPLRMISADFYKSQKAIGKLKSPGLYPDLAASTKRDRVRRKQSLYPILKRTGALLKSTESMNDKNAVNVVTKTGLAIGTTLRYGLFHQRGTNKMPMRKFLFIGPEARRFASSDQIGRLQRWLGILNAYALEKARVLGKTI